MPYRTYDGYGTWTDQPDTIYDGYGSWIRNPALPPDYDGYGNFWNKETDPNWIPPVDPAAAAAAPETPTPAPVAPPVEAAPVAAAPAAAAPAAAAPAAAAAPDFGPHISAGTPITPTAPATTGALLASTIKLPKPQNDTTGSINITQ